MAFSADAYMYIIILHDTTTSRDGTATHLQKASCPGAAPQDILLSDQEGHVKGAFSDIMAPGRR